MTREELKTHCEKQIKMCKFCEDSKIYEEHELILELLEQESYYKDMAQSYEGTIYKLIEAIADQADVFDKIRAEINQLPSYVAKFADDSFASHIDKEKVLLIIDKYRKVESEENNETRD